MFHRQLMVTLSKELYERLAQEMEKTIATFPDDPHGNVQKHLRAHLDLESFAALCIKKGLDAADEQSAKVPKAAAK